MLSFNQLTGRHINSTARPKLQAQLALVRRGNLTPRIMRLTLKSAEASAKKARASKDAWTAYHADALAAAIKQIMPENN
jgi:hypothetical protein